MSSSKSRDNLKFNLALLWLVFTFAFAVWWFKLSLAHVSQLAELQPGQSENWDAQKRMIVWEGTAWLILLAVGGGALIVLVQQQKQTVQSLRQFFASFSHEVKTSLASLRLQAESLKDDLRGQASPILDRLIGDTVRLHLQLENSLFFASQDTVQLYSQTLSLNKILEGLREQWPGMDIQISHEAQLQGDERALRTVFNNFIQNAIVHGQANRLTVQVMSAENGLLRVSFRDNGKGFSGDVSELGNLFHRPSPTSGSGLGLYIARLLLERMGGGLELKSENQGFVAEALVAGESK